MTDLPLVSSVRVEKSALHDVVAVFNRGANAGTLTVSSGDGLTLARRLLPGCQLEEFDRGVWIAILPEPEP